VLGRHCAGQVAFHQIDTSYRIIPTEIPLTSRHALRPDGGPCVVFPIDPLRQLVKEGVIGALAEHAFTFMGGIYSARRVQDDLAPQLTAHMLAEGVDALLLVPV
jgi:D-proline reductase (dithiol) PrdB